MMRRVLGIAATLCMLPAAFADSGVRKTELRNEKKAQKDYSVAMSLIRDGDFARAQSLIDRALLLDPNNVQALTARELLRQHEIQQKISEANRQLGAHQHDQAMAGFRDALKLDPGNLQAQEGLRALLAQAIPAMDSRPRIQYQDADAISLEPAQTPADLHYTGDSRGLLQRLWSAYSIRPLIDSSVISKQVRFDLEGADFATAITLASQMTKTFYVPLSKTQALILADTPENRRNYERLALRIFYVSEASSPAGINDVVTMLRTIFDFRFVTPAAASNQITVRAPRDMLDAATRILEDLFSGKPQIMLEVNVFQIEETLALDLGIGLPTRFTLFNVNTEAQKLLGGSNQSLINQLISSGAINQANSSSIAALLAGLAAGGQSSILNQPIATFGGGISRSGVIVPGVSGHFTLNKSSFRAIDQITLRAAQSDTATFRDGTRYPILNASFAPIFNNPAISQVLGNQSFRPPFPSFSYEDLGLTLKATPTIHGSQYVSLKLEFQLRGLGATQLNGVPVITNREYNGNISLPMGETAVLLGMMTKSEQLSLQGLPGLSQLPILGAASSLHNKQTDDAELLITIRPQLVRDSLHTPGASTAFVPPPVER
jgi:type II secretory pathway component GspD/PulD (secretin)